MHVRGAGRGRRAAWSGDGPSATGPTQLRCESEFDAATGNAGCEVQYRYTASVAHVIGNGCLSDTDAVRRGASP